MDELKCPRCASMNTAEIHYGADSHDDPEVEVVRFGGRKVVTEKETDTEKGWGPRFHCHDCRRNFGSISLRPDTRTDAENYREATRGIVFETGGRMQGLFILSLEKTGKGCFMQVSPGFEPDRESGRIETGKVRITPEQWDEVVRTLYEELFVLDWKDAYENPHVVDGHEWRLVLTMENGAELSYRGLNGYPVYWDKALRLFDPKSIMRIGSEA